MNLQLTSHRYQPWVFWQIINFKVFTHYNSRFRELSHICGSRLSYTPYIPVSFWTFLGNRIRYSGMDDWIAFELSNGLLNSKMSETRSWYVLDQARTEIAVSSDVHVCLDWSEASSCRIQILSIFFLAFVRQCQLFKLIDLETTFLAGN